MPTYDRECNVEQAFNFMKDKQSTFGAISMLKIGTTAFTADLVISDPTAVGAAVADQTTQTAGTLGVVSVLEKVTWEGLGDVKPIQFAGWVSAANKQLLNSLLFTALSNVEVLIEWVVFEYDLLAKVYYRGFCTQPQATPNGATGGTPTVFCVINKNGDDLDLKTEEQANQDIVSPKLFKIEMTLAPQPKVHNLYLAASDTQKVQKTWGRAVTTARVGS